MSAERRDAQLEQWIGELEYFDRNPAPFIVGSITKKSYGPGEELIDLSVTRWLRREAAAMRFRRMLYGET